MKNYERIEDFYPFSRILAFTIFKPFASYKMFPITVWLFNIITLQTVNSVFYKFITAH